MEAALAVLGVTEHHWLDYPDGGCAEVDQDEAVRRVTEVMAAVRPDTVLTFGPDGMTGHADHMAVCRWATAAFDAVAPSGAVLGYAPNTPEWLEQFEEPLEQFDVFMGVEPPCTPREELLIGERLAGGLLETKLRAIRAMTSQVEPLLQGLGADVFRDCVVDESYRPR